MKGCPFEYQRHGPPREVSPQDGERLYLNEGLIFAIFGMGMRGAVVAEVHSNHNPKESRHLGHSFFDLTPFTLRSERQGPAAARVFGDQGAGIGVSQDQSGYWTEGCSRQ